MSRNTVKKYVDSLIDKRLIYTEPTTVTRQDGTKWNGNLRYTIRPIQEAKEYYVERQMEAYARDSLAQSQEGVTSPI